VVSVLTAQVRFFSESTVFRFFASPQEVRWVSLATLLPLFSNWLPSRMPPPTEIDFPPPTGVVFIARASSFHPFAS